MGKRQLTTDQKRDIFRRVRTENEKVSDLAKEYDRSIGAIYKIVNGKTGLSTNRERKDSVFTDDVRYKINSMVMADENTTAEEIKTETGIDVALSTIHRYLRREGFTCSNTKKPSRFISPSSAIASKLQGFGSMGDDDK